jgi:hypothetical protein
MSIGVKGSNMEYGKWLVSSSDEYWDYDEERCFSAKEEAEKYAREEFCRAYDCNSAWIGQIECVDEPSIDVDGILDHLSEHMGDEVGDASEGWPSMSIEEQDALYKELNEVLMKHLKDTGNWPPSFFSIGDMYEYIIPESKE